MLYTPYVLPLVFASLFCACAAFYAWRYRGFPAVGYFIALMVLSAGWTLMYGLSISTLNVPLRITFTNWMYLFTRLIPPAVFLMTMEYTGHDRWFSKRHIMLLLVIPAIAILASVTSPLHHLFRWDFALDTGNTIPVLRYRGGIIYTISSIYGDALSLLSLLALILGFGDRVLVKANTALILTGMVIPVIANALFTLGISPISGYNFAPTSLVFTAICYLSALLGFKMFSFTPIARGVVMEHIEDLVIVFDARKQIVDFNPAAALACALDKRRHRGATADSLGNEWGDFFRKTIERGEVQEEVSITINGQHKVYDLHLAIIEDALHRPRGKMILLHDITLLRKLLSEKELLLKEVHHRIKNNMTVISSILSLQAQSIDNEPAQAALKEARGRVQSMMLLYERLYRTENLTAIGLEEYFSPLIDRILATFDSSSRIEIRKELDEVALSPRLIFSLGIILNELITNAMKHAFTDRAAGANAFLLIRARCSDGVLTLTVADNGRGLPAGFCLENATGFGLQLVATMIQQVNGNLSIEREGGTTYHLAIPFPQAL